MKKNTGLIIKIAVAIVVLAAASACFIIFRDAIFEWLQGLKNKFLTKKRCFEEFDDFDEE